MKDSGKVSVCQDAAVGIAAPPEKRPPAGIGVQPEPAGVVFPRDERSESLLFLYSNNCTEEYHKKAQEEKLLASCGILSPYHQRQAHTLYLNSDRFVGLAPSLDYIGFFTITTPDNCTDYKELGKRWHSFNSHFLKKSPDFLHYLGTKERQERGALHFHLLVQVREDIRTGFDWDNYTLARDLKKEKKPWRQVASKCYRSATPYLKDHLWPLLRHELPKYGFGRSELLPIRSSVEAIARYVGGYLGKHIAHREQWDKGMRLMVADQGWIKNCVRFQFLTPGSGEWRRKVALFAAILKCATLDDIQDRLGEKWCYRYQDVIRGIDEVWENVEDAPF